MSQANFTEKSKRRSAHAKGLRLQRLARECLEAEGWLVEAAQNAVVWVQDKRRTAISIAGMKPALRPISIHHDIFGLWDLIAVHEVLNPRHRNIALIQVTVLEHISERRRTIIKSGFPCSTDDMLLGWKGGHDRHFRVFRGPAFERWEGECLRLAKGDK
jgi:hypothetical protein